MRSLSYAADLQAFLRRTGEKNCKRFAKIRSFSTNRGLLAWAIQRQIQLRRVFVGDQRYEDQRPVISLLLVVPNSAQASSDQPFKDKACTVIPVCSYDRTNARSGSLRPAVTMRTEGWDGSKARDKRGESGS